MISRFLGARVFLFFMLLGMLFVFAKGVFAGCNTTTGVDFPRNGSCDYCEVRQVGSEWCFEVGTGGDGDPWCTDIEGCCDTQAEAQAFCSAGLNDYQKSFNGVVLSPNGTRWKPGSNCAANLGNLSVSSTAGTLLGWAGSSTADYRFDYYKVYVNNANVTVTLSPPTNCGYGCGTWSVRNNINGTTLASGNGCAATFNFIPASSGWTRTVTFNLALLAPTATPTPSPCPTISAPGGLACNVPGSSISWNAVTGAHHYALRVDANPTSWSGTCSSVNPGDFCNDVYALSQSYSFVPGASHTVWVAAINSCNSWSLATYLSCPGPTLTPVATIAPTATPTAVPVCAGAVSPSFWVANNRTYENAIDLRWSGTSLEFQYQRFNDATCAGGVAVNNCPDPDGRDTISVNTNDEDKWVCAQVRGKNYANGGTCVSCSVNNPPNCCVSDWSRISRCAFCKHPTGVSTSPASCSGYDLSGNPSSWTGTRISWTDESAVESGFVVYRCPLNTSCPASFSQAISFPAANASSYTDCTYGFNYGSYLYAVRCYSDSCGTVPRVTPTLIPTPACIPSCALACGQANGCGGFCAGTDLGAPAGSTMVSPKGTAASPTVILNSSSTTLTWQQNSSALTDYYQVEVWRVADGVRVKNSLVVGRANVTLATGVLAYNQLYYWRVRAVNETCETYEGLRYGTWSTQGYFVFNRAPSLIRVEIKNKSGKMMVKE